MKEHYSKINFRGILFRAGSVRYSKLYHLFFSREARGETVKKRAVKFI